MKSTSRGDEIYSVPSNRPPFYTDATTTGNAGLLAASNSKTIAPALPGNGSEIPVAQKCVVINSSGQTAKLDVTTKRYLSADTSQEETTLHPIIILSGDTLTLESRIVSIKETNTGGSTQTGQGVRYLFTMEPTR